MKKLDKSFFSQEVVNVAQSLLGKILVFKEHKGIIVETEAYRGIDDPASHAYRGITPRTAPMFGPPGVSYVYFIYGMYHCLNVVTQPEGEASAVLIRGLHLITPPRIHLNGPGKLCKFLGITKEQNNLNLVEHKDFYITDPGKASTPPLIDITPRIGISKGQDKLWRFVLKDIPRD